MSEGPRDLIPPLNIALPKMKPIKNPFATLIPGRAQVKKTATVLDLIRATQIKEQVDVEAFHHYRRTALEVAGRIFDDRAASYNVDHEPFDEMPYGVLSLVSELFKRTIRMTGLITPLRTEPLRPEDVSRLADSTLDLINYASWAYAMIMIGKSKLDFGGEVEVDAPKDADVSPERPIPGGRLDHRLSGSYAAPMPEDG